MRNGFFNTFPLVFLLFLPIPLFGVAWSQDYFVNPVSGSNGNDGQAVDRAWKTITYGLTQVPPGATLNLASGVYDATSGEVFPMNLTRSIGVKGSGYETTRIINDATDVDTFVYFTDGGVGPVLGNIAFVGGRIGEFGTTEEKIRLFSKSGIALLLPHTS